MAQVIASSSRARADRRPAFAGYGELVQDPEGLLDLPPGFRYRVFSRTGDPLSGGGLVPGSHDGMGAFSAGPLGTLLVRNHELEPEDVEEDGALPVSSATAPCYDRDAPGGTTTLWVSPGRQLLRHKVSLSGTANNCGGGRTPWGTWLTCEEIVDTFGKPHGYVFEVDPLFGGNPEPIRAMGRMEHEAVAFARNGVAFLTEDASAPLGSLYRFEPRRALRGRGSLHAGGSLAALSVRGLESDLSVVQTPGTVLDVRWLPVPNADPADGEISVREQAEELGATLIKKAEGMWTDADGSIWFTASFADGPNAEDPEDITAAAHSGQIWRLDPRRNTMELVVIFPKGSPFDGPDNITTSPHGFALACTDGEDDQYLLAIDDAGRTFPFAFNALNDSEFAGATFSPDGETLFVNLQDPGLTVAIWGPWRKGR